VLGLAADRHGVAPAAGQRLLQGPLRIEAFAALIERGHLQVGAQLDGAGIGRKRAGQEADQRGLAAAVGADDTNAVATHHAHRQIAHDRPIPERLGDILRSRSPARRMPGLAGRDHGLTGRLAVVAPALAQRHQIGHAPHVALAPGGDAVAPPVLRDDLAIELVLRQLSSARRSSRRASKLEKPISTRRAWPRSSQTVLRDSVSRKRRSRLISTSADR
jgi:hypothetical protein